MKVIYNLFCKLKKIFFFSFFGPVWEIDHAQKFFKFFEFFQLKSKTRINFRNSPKKSKKNTKNCHEDKKLKVAPALCAPPGGIGLNHDWINKFVNINNLIKIKQMNIWIKLIQVTADLFTFTEEILDGKLHFFV